MIASNLVAACENALPAEWSQLNDRDILESNIHTIVIAFIYINVTTRVQIATILDFRIDFLLFSVTFLYFCGDKKKEEHIFTTFEFICNVIWLQLAFQLSLMRTCFVGCTALIGYVKQNGNGNPIINTDYVPQPNGWIYHHCEHIKWVA